MTHLLDLLVPRKALSWGSLTGPWTSDLARAVQQTARFCDAFAAAFGPPSFDPPPATVRIRAFDALIRCTYWAITACERTQIALSDRRNALALRQWEDNPS